MWAAVAQSVGRCSDVLTLSEHCRMPMWGPAMDWRTQSGVNPAFAHMCSLPVNPEGVKRFRWWDETYSLLQMVLPSCHRNSYSMLKGHLTVRTIHFQRCSDSNEWTEFDFKQWSPCVLDSLSCFQAAMSLLFSSRCAIYPHSAPSFIRISAPSQKRRDSSPVSHRKTTQQTQADVFFFLSTLGGF